MCKMLLSVNPEHVNNIFKGVKLFEYRKIRCSRRDVDKIIIYATAPVMKIVGEARIMEVIVDNPETVWGLTKEYSGIEKVFFDQYYQDKKKAIAYRLGEIIRYDHPKPLTDYGISFAPQSFVYVD